MNHQEFKKTIWYYYRKHKRLMPWRKTTDPYQIVVSEIMLQQTQVPRVLVKFKEFISKFPDFKTLAESSTADVLKVWSGMGYNRRALYLKQIAETVINKFRGLLPQDPLELDKLPGIGPATAHSIATFAFNYPGVFIETNIRRVYIHHFFSDKESVDDKDVLPLIEESIDKDNPREWYYALMDYGTMLAKTTENPNRKSKHYTVQSQFEGSDRQMRGGILKALVEHSYLSFNDLSLKSQDEQRVRRNLNSLIREGFVMEENGKYKIK